MSIASELSRLQQAKSDLATSIANKGVTVPAATTIDGYAALVDQIQTGGGTLPYDAEVEYLESNGTQYIDTLYKPNGQTRIKAKGRYTHPTMTSSDSMHYLFGVRDGSTFYDMLWNYYRVSSKNYFPTYLHYGTDTAEWNNDDRNKDVEVDLSYEGGYYNGEKKLTVTGTANQSNYSLYLFWCNVDGVGQSNRPPYGRIYYFKIYESGVLLHSFIPVRIGNVGYLYDNVSGKFIGNAGSGNFILGADIT